MSQQKDPFEVEMTSDEVADVVKDINRFYSEITIVKVNGECPYGHKGGEQYMTTGMNHAGICGGLWHQTRRCPQHRSQSHQPGLFAGLPAAG